MIVMGRFYPDGMPATAKLCATGEEFRAFIQPDRKHVEVMLDTWVRFRFTKSAVCIRLRLRGNYPGNSFTVDRTPDSKEWPTRCTLPGYSTLKEEGGIWPSELHIFGH